ncbi:MAG: type IV pilin [Methanomicrobiales archaeon]|nr:type IV pilin [Methanomicrobiales archaeon]
MSIQERTRDDGVSPVVGVMLMLVVTIIIGAVVSGFSGGLLGSGNNQKTPTMTMDIKVANTGSWVGSGFSATVTGTSDPIQTKDIKIITAWKKKDSSGMPIIGGNVSYGQPLLGAYTCRTAMYQPPYGFGPGVQGEQQLSQPYASSQWFGNYTLIQGTGLSAVPSGAASGDVNAIDGVSGTSATSGYGITPGSLYTYTDQGTADPAQMVLGGNWNLLRSGDTVTVTFIHIPSGKVILSKDVMVTG